MGLSRRQLPFIASSTFLLAGGVLFFAFPIRYIYQYCIVVEDSNGLYLALLSAGTVYMIIFYLFVISTFFLSSFVDPGVYPRESTNEEDDFRQPLYRVITVNGIVVRMKWCETCKFYRPPRCSHCSICDCCVEKFDHHCPWVDNCIGNRNYKYFFLFVNSLSIFILTGFCWGALSVYLLAIQDELLYGIVDFVLMAVGVIAFIPVVGLAGFHCGLVCMGRTTNEHVTGKYRTTGNPFDMGCRRNCCFVLCATKKPRYINYVMKAYRTNRLRAVSHLTPQAEPTPLYEVVRDVGSSAHNNAANAVQMPSPVSNGATSGNEAEHYEDAQMTEITV